MCVAVGRLYEKVGNGNQGPCDAGQPGAQDSGSQVLIGHGIWCRRYMGAGWPLVLHGELGGSVTPPLQNETVSVPSDVQSNLRRGARVAPAVPAGG